MMIKIYIIPVKSNMWFLISYSKIFHKIGIWIVLEMILPQKWTGNDFIIEMQSKLF